ncbi:type II toxin-antitoxin system RelE/ParE family toxin [Uliginosibacterium sediminicola]|uniref:Type II toxin-antitoxin system RelE/ParE family toxin n=1 Tax=Uliginosibacterium sediminicola TaxID=2024550 RepID=A0ABU9Z0C6_9RHOO
MSLAVRIKPRAVREIEKAAAWWADNRPAAPGAIRKDIAAALALLVDEPGIGSKIETARPIVVRRLYLPRIQYFLYYRIQDKALEVVAFWHQVGDKALGFKRTLNALPASTQASTPSS